MRTFWMVILKFVAFHLTWLRLRTKTQRHELWTDIRDSDSQNTLCRLKWLILFLLPLLVKLDGLETIFLSKLHRADEIRLRQYTINNEIREGNFALLTFCNSLHHIRKVIRNKCRTCAATVKYCCYSRGVAQLWFCTLDCSE